jgi:hypothetical protein
MQKVINLSLIMLLLFIGLNSCKKDNLDQTQVTNKVIPSKEIVNNLIDNVGSRSSLGLELGCIVVNFPFSMLNEDSTITFFSNLAAFENAISNANFKPIDFVYPLNITKEDGTVVSATSLQGLTDLFSECIPTGGWDPKNNICPAFDINFQNSCYELQYPLQVEDENGTKYSVANSVNLGDLLASKNVLHFVFPVTLKTETGAFKSVNSAEELFNLLIACDGVVEPIDSSLFGYLACLEIKFPMQIRLDNGTVENVKNAGELTAFYLKGNFADFVYPFTVKNPNGSEITITSSNNLDQVISQVCGMIDPIDPVFPDEAMFLLISNDADFTGVDSSCYKIQYPIIITDSSNVVIKKITVQNFNAFKTLLSTPNGLENLHLDFPVNLKMNVDGRIETLSNLNALKALINNCK